MQKQKQKLEKVLKESIKRHHVSDVEVGGFLSGGIDSNYLATGLEKGKTFTVGFGGEDNWYSEISHAEELKKSYPLKCYSKIIRKDDFWHAVPQVAYYLVSQVVTLRRLHYILWQERHPDMSRWYGREKGQMNFLADTIFTVSQML